MRIFHVFGRPGSDLLSRVLRRSTIGAGTFHGRVRNGIGCSRSAITTRSAKHMNEKLEEAVGNRQSGLLLAAHAPLSFFRTIISGWLSGFCLKRPTGLRR